MLELEVAECKTLDVERQGETIFNIPGRSIIFPGGHPSTQ